MRRAYPDGYGRGETMVLLSQMFRHAAITGRPDTLDASWFAGRQGGRWVEQTVQGAMPAGGRVDPAETVRKLEELQERGVITDAELEVLRERLRQD